jgi:tRNA (adenine22-N1)-methyltransferase
LKLGKRLAAIAAMVPAGSRLADIGTDHAYLPVHLVSQGVVAFAVAADVHRGPCRSALETVRRHNLTDRIALRCGDGLAVLTPGEVDTAVIAGMGGPSIIAIRSAQPAVTASLGRLILQPMLAAAAVRRWLVANGWRLVDEELVIDDGRPYEIIVAEPAAPDCCKPIEPILYEIGPLLWAKRHSLLPSHLASLIAQLQQVLAAMENSPQARQSAKYREYREKIVQLEAMFSCL